MSQMPRTATTLEMPSDTEVVMTHVVDAPRDRVYEAYANPTHLSHWMLGPEGWTMPVCEMDLRPGGAWHYVWRRQDGTEMSMQGVYREVVPPERLVNTENWGGDWPETVNTVTFAEVDGKTRITTRITYPTREARDAAVATGMKEGASVSFNRLATYLATLP